MRQKRFRIRTLMIAVALTAVVLVVTRVVLQWLDVHIHDFYMTSGSPR